MPGSCATSGATKHRILQTPLPISLLAVQSLERNQDARRFCNTHFHRAVNQSRGSCTTTPSILRASGSRPGSFNCLGSASLTFSRVAPEGDVESLRTTAEGDGVGECDEGGPRLPFGVMLVARSFLLRGTCAQARFLSAAAAESVSPHSFFLLLLPAPKPSGERRSARDDETGES